MADCVHQDFEAAVKVARLSDGDGGPVTGFSAEVSILCVKCRIPFRFLGLAAGNHYAEPRVNVDGTELRAPIEPATHQVFQPRASYTTPPRGKH